MTTINSTSSALSYLNTAYGSACASADSVTKVADEDDVWVLAVSDFAELLEAADAALP